MKQTAVEWLVEHYNLEMKINGEIHVDLLNKLFEQAKAMEKKQILDAWLIDGYTDLTNDYWRIEFDEYYNETFKSESYQQKMRDKVNNYRNNSKSE